MVIAIDPVCKMEVEESKAVATSEYKGKKYYFCDLNCKRYFDEELERFTEVSAEEALKRPSWR